MSNKKPTVQEKKEYISGVLKEVERVTLIAVDYNEDERLGMDHPLELIAHVLAAYAKKSLEKSQELLQKQLQAAESEIVQPIPKDNVVEIKKKDPTFH